MGLSCNYRFPAPQEGVPAPKAPTQVQNDPLLPPTDQTIRDYSKMEAEYPGMADKIGHHYVQQFMQRLNKQGPVFGPTGSTFSGSVDFD